ncbi:DUF4194 domain-containing protein [Agaribacterium haliotis]|uniref:DUF4194 domain-containing protein n=1 Tax=Agaribacterium haliotis TaxID=2013869 RepID=UPI000BB54E71|nr:DUF4194 domain-containing protein [Agaribacterium haliotis]
MLEDLIKQELAKLNIAYNDFSELLCRLLDYGVINRDESGIEAQLYDRYLVCAELVEEYLNVIGLRLMHDAQFMSLRVFPPSAEVPGLIDDIHRPFNGGMRYRPSQQEVAIILILRVEYEKALREGLVDDKGCVMLAFEALSMAMSNLLKRPLPENASERMAIFKRLRQLRLIQFANEEALAGNEYWLSIQPAIVNFVSSEALDALYPSTESDVEKSNNINREAENSDVL